MNNFNALNPEDHHRAFQSMEDELEDYDHKLDLIERYGEWDHEHMKQLSRVLNKTYEAMEDAA